MRITIDLEPETAEALQTEAAVRGIAVEDYLGSLASQLGARSKLATSGSNNERLRAWEEFCQPIPGVPHLSEVDLSREVIYSDHN